MQDLTAFTETGQTKSRSKWLALTSVERISDSPPEGSYSPEGSSQLKRPSQQQLSDEKENFPSHSNSAPSQEDLQNLKTMSAPAYSAPLQERRSKQARGKTWLCQTQPLLYPSKLLLKTSLTNMTISVPQQNPEQLLK